jgi:pimeloyl-ACP methyl ester carboxylesterase
MLALAFAAAHPELAGPIALAGCGTFNPLARAEYRKRMGTRLTDALRELLSIEIADPDERLRRRGEALLPAYSYDLSEQPSPARCDARAHDETWDDMLRLQDSGVYPAAFAAIRGPVLMLHGADDPHPGRMILESLQPFLPQLEYRELAPCGHYPWLERWAREDFFSALATWLGKWN